MWRHHNKNFLFLMAQFPVLISRSIQIEGERKGLHFVSCTFIARFADGTEKFLNSKKWQDNRLLRPCDLEHYVLDESPLYKLDWSKNPIRGIMAKNYPLPI